MNPEATKKWAECQDRIFAGEAKPEDIFEFWGIGLAQEKITPTNLTLRSRLILAATVEGGLRDQHLKAALSQFNALHRNGYWREQKGYWDYTLKGMSWYNARHGLPEDVLKVMESISENYRNLAPCPLPEVHDEGFPEDGLDFVSTPSYFCKRWRKDGKVTAYLLVALDSDPEPRKNLHHHLEAGYFAFGSTEGDTIFWVPQKEGEPCVEQSFHWLHRCKPYTGFNFQESLTSSSLAECLPKGALPPTWRAKPPRVTVKQDSFQFSSGEEYRNGERWIVMTPVTIFTFTWQYLPFLTITRTIHVFPDKVVVTDGGTFRKSRTTQYGV